MPCRWYVPASTGTAGPGAIVYAHGGGFVFGDLETHDAQARQVADRTGLPVLAVDYRRPPEHRFPAAPDDVETALHWLAGSAPGLGVDVSRLVVLGDSAGANLVLVAALRLEAAGVPTELATYPGMVHGFWRHPAQFDAAEESLEQIAAFLRRTLV